MDVWAEQSRIGPGVWRRQLLRWLRVDIHQNYNGRTLRARDVADILAQARSASEAAGRRSALTHPHFPPLGVTGWDE
jgi:hypothetical protein